MSNSVIFSFNKNRSCVPVEPSRTRIRNVRFTDGLVVGNFTKADRRHLFRIKSPKNLPRIFHYVDFVWPCIELYRLAFRRRSIGPCVWLDDDDNTHNLASFMGSGLHHA